MADSPSDRMADSPSDRDDARRPNNRRIMGAKHFIADIREQGRAVSR